MKRQPVVVLPIGSVEDHGPHLPLDVDNFLIRSICEVAAQQAEGDILLMPIIPFGYETHHLAQQKLKELAGLGLLPE